MDSQEETIPRDTALDRVIIGRTDRITTVVKLNFLANSSPLFWGEMLAYRRVGLFMAPVE
jgi:hypothetical protein